MRYRLSDNRHLNALVESVTGNMGDHARNDKESGSNDVETHHKSSDVLGWSQRGHSSRSEGKPRTGRRATAYQVPQSTTTPPIIGASRWETERKRG